MVKLKKNKWDSLFSKIIRTRDNWRCSRPRCRTQYLPPTNALHNSHYFGRSKYSTRFDEENCDALCHGCHSYWGSTDPEGYRNFKINQLVEDGFNALMIRSNMRASKSDYYNEIYYLALQVRYKEINEKYQQTTLLSY